MKGMGDREGFRRRHGQRYFRAVHLITIFIGLEISFPPGLAQNAPVPQSRGVVQGQITVAGSAEPIPNARITLSGGPFDPRALEVFMEFLNSRGIIPSVRTPENADEKFFQSLMDMAADMGVSASNPEIRNALNTFRTTNDSRFTGLTDNAGRFTIPNVPPGQYTVRAQREGFFGGPTTVEDPTVATAPAIVGEGQTATATLTMFRGAAITGQIRDTSGRPVTGAVVDAFRITYSNGLPVLQSILSMPTDDKGDYRLAWLPPGEYRLSVAPGGPADISVMTEHQVRTFYPGFKEVSSAVPIVVRVGERVESISFAIQTATPAKISGRINSSVPLPSRSGVVTPFIQATMMLLTRDTTTPDVIGTVTNPGVRNLGSAQVDASGGAFEVTGILPGSYDLYARLPEPRAGAGVTFGHAPVEVVRGNVSDVIIKVDPTVPVQGSVSLDGNIPRHDIRVAVQVEGSAAKIPLYQAIATRPALVSRQNGSFIIPGVMSGRFRVAVHGLQPGEYIADVRQSVSVFDSGFEIGGEPPIPIQVLLRTGAGTIIGTVVDMRGKPMAGATVVLIPPEARRENRALYQIAKSDSSGRFTVHNIAPGSYKLFAWQDVTGGAYYNGPFVSKHENQGKAITIASSATVTGDIVGIPVNGQ
jgi:hypothetical protein